MPNDSGPASLLVAVTKSDTVDIAPSDVLKSRVSGLELRGLLVGTAGTATIIDWHNQEHADVPLQKGYNPIRIRRVKTGGTADDIWGLYW